MECDTVHYNERPAKFPLATAYYSPYYAKDRFLKYKSRRMCFPYTVLRMYYTHLTSLHHSTHYEYP